MNSDRPTPGIGRGRARARVHRSISPRPRAEDIPRAHDDQPSLAHLQRPVVAPGAPSFPETTARVAQLSISDETAAASVSSSAASDTEKRGSMRGFRQSDSLFQDYRIRTRPITLESKQGTKGKFSKFVFFSSKSNHLEEITARM